MGKVGMRNESRQRRWEEKGKETGKEEGWEEKKEGER